LYGTADSGRCLAGRHVVFVGDSTLKETVADALLLLLGLRAGVPAPLI
jgi:hypothetical protein